MKKKQVEKLLLEIKEMEFEKKINSFQDELFFSPQDVFFSSRMNLFLKKKKNITNIIFVKLLKF